ncbi:MAG: terminase family protein [Bacteroidales bacterium]|nr:terminase family protein [Bacteroidales bacterium]
MDSAQKIIRPQAGFQEKFVSTNVDFCVGGGVLNCGKSFAAVLSVAEPSMDSRFRGLFLRNNLGDARASGGLLDTFKEVYGNAVDVVESGEPRVTFKHSGSKIDVTHVSDQSRDKVLQRFKGRQYDFIYFDEGTGFTWECFTAIYTRNRGTAAWTGKVRMTTNPDRNHWLRIFLDWYIGLDGFIREDREGVVRYFYLAGETVKDVVWGDTKLEVYNKCKIDIDRKLAKINGATGKATYEDMIKSFTFYLGRISENKASIGNNSGYVGSVAVSGGRNAEQLLEGNWNVSPDEDLDAPIPSEMANQVFMNDEQRNGDKWVTCDLADTGTDNFLCIAWDGFHIYDILMLGQTTPRQNAEQLEMFATKHGISNSHIIYDAIRGTYINDYIPEAIPFMSSFHPQGMYGRMTYNLKAECYMRLVEAIKQQYISVDEAVANKTYEHRNLKQTITVQNEFLEECAVVRFKDMPSGKKALISKKEMNAKLGKSRSMDLLDPCAMRFYPCLEYPYGEELQKTAAMYVDDIDEDSFGQKESIYDDSYWC